MKVASKRLSTLDDRNRLGATRGMRAARAVRRPSSLTSELWAARSSRDAPGPIRHEERLWPLARRKREQRRDEEHG
jgi:hypothetical protein